MSSITTRSCRHVAGKLKDVLQDAFLHLDLFVRRHVGQFECEAQQHIDVLQLKEIKLLHHRELDDAKLVAEPVREPGELCAFSVAAMARKEKLFGAIGGLQQNLDLIDRTV